MDLNSGISIHEWKQATNNVEALVHFFFVRNRHKNVLKEDLYQEAWTAVVLAKRTWSPTGGRSFSSWVYKIVQQDLLNFVRGSVSVSLETIEAPHARSAPMDEAIDTNAMVERLHTLLSPAAYQILTASLSRQPGGCTLSDLSHETGFSKSACRLLRRELRTTTHLVMSVP